MAASRPAQPVDPRPGPTGILCPYCGQVSLNPKRCDACAGFFDPLSRQASQNAMGPWYIRDAKSPFRPGCSFETVRELVKRGRIVRETVIRGPATRQFWNFAGRTPTIANLLGICHNCGGDVSPEAFSCGACGAVFTPETDRQHLGLAPVHLLPGQASPEIIASASGAPARKAVVKTNGPARAAGIPPPNVRAAPGRWMTLGLGIGVLLVVGGVIAGVVYSQGLGERLWSEVTGGAAPEAAPTETHPPPVTVAESPPAEAPSETSGTEGPSGASADSGTTPEPAPAPEAKPRQDAPVPPPVAVDELGAIRATLAAGTDFDQKELLRRIDEIKTRSPGKTAEADALADLVRKRAEQDRLKKLP
jgi:hypothetical protein